jgi:Na+/H+ antiporter NhaD/arsenite permease-like protein
METVIVIAALIGYAIFVFEHPLKVNKAATALLTGGICWTLFTFSGFLPHKIHIEVKQEGQTAEQIDALILAPIEENLAGLKGVKFITTQSDEGSGKIMVTFQEDTKMSGAIEEVRNLVAKAKVRLPDDAVVEHVNIEDSIEFVNEELAHHLSEIAAILFFLIGAMTIVELIDSHHGFKIVTDRITTSNARTLLWVICFLTFFLSAVLDNLTTSIVMVSLLRKILADANQRRFYAGMVVIAANSGGAWSPIGDVTTTMLWIGGQVSAGNIMLTLIIPSLISMIVPLLAVTFSLKGNVDKPIETNEITGSNKIAGQSIIFLTGILGLVMVPAFKTITHLPPYVGMLIALAIVWIVSEIVHFNEDEERKKHYSPIHALAKIDIASVLFFMGILMMIGSLESIGILRQLSLFLKDTIGNLDVIVLIIGVASSIIDNVPLVAASMGMYDIAVYPMDSKLWEFLAYAAGTGGSILIIGSAAGVAVMGIEKIDFIWYVKKISIYALIGYFAGAGAYVLIYPYFAVH